MRKLDPTPESNQGFDLTVTHRDPHSGLITKQDPYIMRVVGELGTNDRSQMWERPKGSGNCFDKEGNPVGRWISEEKIIKGKRCITGHFVEGAEHIAWAPPLTSDQKIAHENAALKAELAALRAEREPKTQGKK